MSQESMDGTIQETAPGSPAEQNGGAESLAAASRLIAQARGEMGRVIAGQSAVIEEVLIAILCQGHALLDRYIVAVARQTREWPTLLLKPPRGAVADARRASGGGVRRARVSGP